MSSTTDPAHPGTLVLFDLDGTITDSYDGIADSFRHALRTVGAPEPLPEVLAGVAGPPMVDTLRTIGLDSATAERAMTAYRARYTTVGWRQNAVFGGMADLIRDLRTAGRRLAVATSKNQTTARMILEHFSLAQHFDVVAGASDDGVRRHKTDVIAHALTELGVTSRIGADDDARTDGVVMIGDRSHDVLGAAAFGIPTVFVGWGYAVVGRGEPDGVGARNASDVDHHGHDEAQGARWRVSSPAQLREVLGV